VSRLLEALEKRYRTLFSQYDAALDRIHLDGRSQPTDAETTHLQDLAEQMHELSPRIADLRAREERRMSTVLPMPTSEPAGLVQGGTVPGHRARRGAGPSFGQAHDVRPV
jgi:hypothetical protein